MDTAGQANKPTYNYKNTRTNSRWTRWKPVNTTHTHILTQTREREQVLFDTKMAKKAMHSFYKNKKPGKLVN